MLNVGVYIQRYKLSNKIYQMKKSLVFLLFVALALSAEITISCSDSESTCSSGSAYVFTDSAGAQNFECSDTTCGANAGLSFKFNVLNCDLDMTGNNCTSSVCLVPTDQIACVLPSGSCPLQTEVSIQCSDSCSSLDCGSDKCTSTSGVEVCNGMDFCPYESQTTRVYSCSADSQGEACGCCTEVKFVGAVTGICSAGYPFDGDELAKHATDSEPFSQMRFLVLIIALIALMLH